MSSIKILHFSLRPKTSGFLTHQVQYFYANLVFEVNPRLVFLIQYLKNSQRKYIKRKIHKTYKLIDESIPPTIESILNHINTCDNNSELFYEGWDFNPDYGWFTYIPKFDCWRFNEYFTDNAITRALFQQIQNIAFGIPTNSRCASDSELISCFESLKQWCD